MAVLAVPFALSGGRRGALSGIVVALIIGVTYVLTSSLLKRWQRQPASATDSGVVA